MIKRFLLFWLFAVAHTVFQPNASASDTKPIPIRYCTPQNDVYPFFITIDNQLTGINADIVRHIFNHQSLKGAVLQFERRPWKRCNLDLETGNMDMMIGGFEADRKNVVYPSRLGFKLSDSVVTTANVCFSSIAGQQMNRVLAGLEHNLPFTVGIEPGFTKQHPNNISPQWLELYNPIEKYRMLELGRVDAIVQICAMDDVFPIETKAELTGFNQFSTVFPPYLSNPAFIVFSEEFVEKHAELAKQVIELSLSIKKSEIYERYKPKESD